MTDTLITLATPHATVTVSRYGGQVMSFVPAGGPDLLWQTTPDLVAAARGAGKAVRGGIPVCWPWFGPHASGRPGVPSHGLARTARWTIIAEATDRLRLSFETDGSDGAFPYPARAELDVALHGATLQVILATTNLGAEPFDLSAALHTYLRVSTIERATLAGLEGLPGGPTATALPPRPPASGPMTFAGETDHAFAPVSGPLTLAAGDGRRVRLQHAGTREIVVWNPGAVKAVRLDVPPEGWRAFVCIEPAFHTPIRLQPGETATIAQTIEPLLRP